MPDHGFAECIRTHKRFFDTATACFDEADASFAPKPGMFTVAEQIAHTAQTVDWFIDGAFSPDGMRTDYERAEKEVRAVKTLAAARAWMDRACERAVKIVESTPRAEFSKPIVGAVMAGEPREALFVALSDHTAHHRGALAVYARLVGKVPAMPYM